MKWGDKEHCAAIAAMDQAAGNFHALPRYKIESLAMGRGTDDEQARAIEELGRRFASEYNGGEKWYGPRYLLRIGTAYVRGFTGQPGPGYRRNDNRNRPLADAWTNGRRDHANLNMLMNTRGDES